MIEIPFSNGSIHRVKNNWSELSPDQFLDVLDLISLFFSGQLSIRMFRVRLLFIVTGIKLRLSPDTEQVS